MHSRARFGVCVPSLHEQVQGRHERWAKSILSEILRWYPEIFEGKVLNKIAEGEFQVIEWQ